MNKLTKAKRPRPVPPPERAYVIVNEMGLIVEGLRISSLADMRRIHLDPHERVFEYVRAKGGK